MSLQLSDIFPLGTSQGATATAKLLEPHVARKESIYPAHITESSARVLFRKRISRPYVEIAYEYSDITQYEYSLIHNFFRRMKGPYETFYVVDWSTPFKIKSFPANNQLQLYTTTELEAVSGFAGNKLLLYNGRITTATNKEICQINSAETFADTTINLASNITATNLKLPDQTCAYILYPCMFKTDKLSPTIKNYCIDKTEVKIPGYGTYLYYGPIIDITLTFTLFGAINA